jgi:uncharacterized cupin superfamily protein
LHECRKANRYRGAILNIPAPPRKSDPPCQGRGGSANSGPVATGPIEEEAPMDIMTKPAIVRFDANAPLEAWPEAGEGEIAAGSRASRGRVLFEDKKHGITTGVWEAEANLGRWVNYPVNEFMLVIAGEVVMIEEDRETVIRAGESFFIPKGRRCIWNQAGYVKKFFVIFDDRSGTKADAARRIAKIDPKVKLAPSTPPGPDMLLSSVPTQHAHEYFADASGQFTIGVWQTSGYHRKLIDFPRHELMHLLEGSVTFADDRGQSQSFAAGDTFFVPLGTPNSWKSEGNLRKIYCIFQPGK